MLNRRLAKYEQRHPMKKLNPNFLNWIFNFLGMLLVAGMILLVLLAVATGCNPAKKLEQAEQRVRLNPQSFNKIGQEWNVLNPCANDTSKPVITPGKVDSVTVGVLVQVPVFDSEAHQFTVDSVKKAYSGQCNEAIDKAFRAGAAAAYKEISAMKIPIERHDTANYYITDKQRHKLDMDSVHRLNERLRFAEGQSAQKDVQLKEVNKDNKELFWWLVGALIAFAVSNCLWIFGRIKSFNILK